MPQHALMRSQNLDSNDTQERALELVSQMTLREKIGQMSQVNGGLWDIHQAIREGLVGSVLNEVNVDTINELQRVAMEESRLGIPLLIGRDVIHGFKTIFPIPLAQAASWNPQIVKEAAAIAALEASAAGINWTFAPMVDITRDPRWGRIAESLGEDPYLCSILGAAMVKGFQGDSLDKTGSIAACAKHLAGYGAVESGLDYNTTNIPENELRNVYLRPFKAALDAGVCTFMSAFSELNGVLAKIFAVSPKIAPHTQHRGKFCVDNFRRKRLECNRTFVVGRSQSSKDTVKIDGSSAKIASM